MLSVEKTLKQEIEQWKHEYEVLDACCELAQGKIEELKAENDSLKEENYQLQKDCQICENFIDFIPCKPIRDMDYDLQKVINQRDNYYQTLQEIKTIAEKIIIAYTGIAKSNEKLKAFDLRNRLQQILQKITKAEEE